MKGVYSVAAVCVSGLLSSVAVADPGYVRTISAMNDTGGTRSDGIRDADDAIVADTQVIYTGGSFGDACQIAQWHRQYGQILWGQIIGESSETDPCEVKAVKANKENGDVIGVGSQKVSTNSTDIGIIAGFDFDGYYNRDNKKFAFTMTSARGYPISLNDILITETDETSEFIVVGSIDAETAGDTLALVSRVQVLDGVPQILRHWHIGQYTTTQRMYGIIEHTSGKIVVYGRGRPQLYIFDDKSLDNEPQAVSFDEKAQYVFTDATEIIGGNLVFVGYKADALDLVMLIELDISESQPTVVKDFTFEMPSQEFIVRASIDAASSTTNRVIIGLSFSIDGSDSEHTTWLANLDLDRVSEIRSDSADFVTALNFGNDRDLVNDFVLTVDTNDDETLDTLVFGGNSRGQQHGLFGLCELSSGCMFDSFNGDECQGQSTDEGDTWNDEIDVTDNTDDSTEEYTDPSTNDDVNATFAYNSDSDMMSTLTDEIIIEEGLMTYLNGEQIDETYYCGLTFSPSMAPTIQTTAPTIDDDDDDKNNNGINLNNPLHVAVLIIIVIFFCCCLCCCVEHQRRRKTEASSTRSNTSARWDAGVGV